MGLFKKRNKKIGCEIVFKPYYMGITTLETSGVSINSEPSEFLLKQVEAIISNKSLWSDFYNHIYITFDLTKMQGIRISFIRGLIKLLGKYTQGTEIRERVKFINTSHLSTVSRLVLNEWDPYIDALIERQKIQLEKDRKDKKKWNKKVNHPSLKGRDEFGKRIK